jgi:putative FmdB family regulatory protein
MPIYEFYCRDCNTIFDFYSKTVNTEKIPACPMCNREKLERHVSMFASITGKAKDEESAGAEEFKVDEARLERAVGQLSREAESINEDDPRQAALLMRKFSEMAGIRMGTGMEEALARMEAGEDPEQVEAEMGQLLDNDDFMLQGASRAEKAKKNAAPGHDKKLYEL